MKHSDMVVSSSGVERQPVSAVVVSYNRADLIGTCLRALSFADELIVVDKSSTDRTAEIAAAFADRVVTIPWSPTVEESRAFAISLCTHDWILCLDDDECLSVDAVRFIEAELSAPRADIYALPQRHYILGVHDEAAYYWPEHQLRLFRRSAVSIGPTVHGGTVPISQAVYYVPIDTGVCIHHLSHRDTQQWIEKTNRYTSQPNRLRADDGGRDIAVFAHARIDFYQSLTKSSDRGSYAAAVAVLRAVYDIIDRVKAWETEEGFGQAEAFANICRRLEAAYVALPPNRASAEAPGPISKPSVEPLPVVLPEGGRNDALVAELREHLRHARAMSDVAQHRADALIAMKGAALEAEQARHLAQAEATDAAERAWAAKLRQAEAAIDRMREQAEAAERASAAKLRDAEAASGRALEQAAAAEQASAAKLRDAEAAIAQVQEQAGISTAQLRGDYEAALRFERATAEAAHAEAGRLRNALNDADARVAAIFGSTSWRGVARVQAMVQDRPALRRLVRRTAKAVWYTATLQLVTKLRQRQQVAQSPVGLPPSAPALLPQQHLPAVAPVTLQTGRIRATGRPPAPSIRPQVVFLSHVAPYPPRAGNEYRTERLLSWLTSTGWDVVLLYCPLPGEEPDEARLAALIEGCENLVYVHRSGQVRYAVARPDVAAVLAALDQRPTRDVAHLVQEANGGAAGLLELMRTFSPDALVETLCAIDAALTPKLVIANYVFMTRGLKLLREETVTIVDTIDVFSTKAQKVKAFGIEDSLAITEDEEAFLLADADLVLAIQSEEAADLRRIAPDAQVLIAGVDMAVDVSRTTLVADPIVLLVASGNAMNAKGLKDFLRFAWPRIRQAVPTVELRVIGAVGMVVPGRDIGVRRLGFVHNLGEAYAAARVVINPAVAGTGLKIKTLEAFAHLRPLVTWPAGLDGVPDELRALCVCVTDWYAFAEAVIDMLVNDKPGQTVIENRHLIAELLSPEVVYRTLAAQISSRISGTAGELR